MSKIDELLKNEKVEWKKLSEIATLIPSALQAVIH